MNSYRYLFKNIGFLTISQFTSKILTFLLVPLYTSVLSTGEYGSFDLINTTVNLLVPIVTLNVYDAIIIYTLDKKYDDAQVISVGLKYSFIGFILSLAIAGTIALTGLFSEVRQFWYLIPVMVLLNSLSSNLLCFARGLDKVKETAIAGVFGSVTLISSNIIFLLVMKIGLNGYFLAFILSLLVQIVYLSIVCGLKKYCRFHVDSSIEQRMVSYSRPLIANSIGWWINNSSDRYVVTLMCGISVNGIYSVGYKIPSILNVFQTIFSQAWTLSAIKDYDSEDKDGFFSNMYCLYECGMVLVCSVLIATSQILARFLYAKDFYDAWIYVPWLTIAIVFGAMSGFLGGVFAAAKDTKLFGQSTVIGALINIVLNVILVYFVGSVGAAIATAISYISIWVIRVKHVKKHIAVQFQMGRDILSYILLFVQTILLYWVQSSLLLYGAELIIFLLIIFLYRVEFEKMLQKIKTRTSGGQHES